jgi:hypothetical protein
MDGEAVCAGVVGMEDGVVGGVPWLAFVASSLSFLPETRKAMIETTTHAAIKTQAVSTSALCRRIKTLQVYRRSDLSLEGGR